MMKRCLVFIVVIICSLSASAQYYDSTQVSRKGVVLLANPTVTNDSSTISRKGVVLLGGSITATTDSTSGSRKGIVLLTNPTITNDSSTLSRKNIQITNTVSVTGSVTSSDSSTSSRKGVVLLASPAITNDSSTLSRKNVQVTNTVAVTGTVTSSDSSTSSRKGIVLLVNPSITNDSSTISRKNVQVTNTVTVSGTVTSSDSSTSSRKGIVLLVNPTITNDSSTLSRKNVQVTNTVTVSGTVTSSDSSTVSRKGVVLLVNPTITNDSSTMDRKLINAHLYSTDSTNLSNISNNTSTISSQLSLSQGSSTSGQKGALIMGAATTSAPSYSTGNTYPISMDRFGGTRVTVTDGSGNAITNIGVAVATYDSVWSSINMDTTGLGAKANSQTVGWISDTIRCKDRQALDYKVGVLLQMANTAPANDKAVYVYLVPWFYDGSGYNSASGGTTTMPPATKQSYTIASPNDFRLLGVMSYTTQQMNLQDVFLASNAFGANMPDAFSIFILDYSGAALAASTHKIKVTPLNKVQR